MVLEVGEGEVQVHEESPLDPGNLGEEPFLQVDDGLNEEGVGVELLLLHQKVRELLEDLLGEACHVREVAPQELLLVHQDGETQSLDEQGANIEIVFIFDVVEAVVEVVFDEIEAAFVAEGVDDVQEQEGRADFELRDHKHLIEATHLGVVRVVLVILVVLLQVFSKHGGEGKIRLNSGRVKWNPLIKPVAVPDVGAVGVLAAALVGVDPKSYLSHGLRPLQRQLQHSPLHPIHRVEHIHSLPFLDRLPPVEAPLRLRSILSQHQRLRGEAFCLGAILENVTQGQLFELFFLDQGLRPQGELAQSPRAAIHQVSNLQVLPPRLILENDQLDCFLRHLTIPVVEVALVVEEQYHPLHVLCRQRLVLQSNEKYFSLQLKSLLYGRQELVIMGFQTR